MSKTRKPRTAKPHANKLGNAIYDLRNRRNENLNEFAKLCGTNASKLSRLERGHDMANGEVKRIADKLGIDCDALARNDIPAVLASAKDPSLFFSAEKSRESQNKMIGNKGEAYVEALEREALKGTPYADAVNANYANDRTAHFDILSFTPEGKPKFIEVKTTGCSKNIDWIISRDELAFLKDCVSKGIIYEIHRVYFLKKSNEFGRDIISAEEVLRDYSLTPLSYSARRVKA